MNYENTDKVIENMKEISKEVELNNRILNNLFPQKEEVVKTMSKGINTKTLAIACGVIAGVAFLAGKSEGIKIGYEKSKEIHSHVAYTRAINDIIGKVKG